MDQAMKGLRERLERYAEALVYDAYGGEHEIVKAMREAAAALARVEELEAALRAGEASDGYHTHRELYEYRMLYNAHAAHGWLAAGVPVVKSRRHSDGEPCFGGGWFIVVAELPTGQVSNHYRDEHWHLFEVPAVDLPPEYDGHTPADAADRLLRMLAAPAPAAERREG